jgi:hypothetical protein
MGTFDQWQKSVDLETTPWFGLSLRGVTSQGSDRSKRIADVTPPLACAGWISRKSAQPLMEAIYRAPREGEWGGESGRIGR